jgi:hypothetical protein
MTNFFATSSILDENNPDKVVLLRSCAGHGQLESPKLTKEKCSLVNKRLSMEQVLQETVTNFKIKRENRDHVSR